MLKVLHFVDAAFARVFNQETIFRCKLTLFRRDNRGRTPTSFPIMLNFTSFVTRYHGLFAREGKKIILIDCTLLL